MSTEIKEIMDKLNEIQSELEYIKEHMVDADTILTEEDKVLLEESYENEKAGKLISSEDLRKKLGI